MSRLVQRGEIAARIAKATKHRGGAAITHLSPQLIPVIIAHDATRYSPITPPSDNRVGTFSFQVAPTAGQFVSAHLFNPTASKVITVPKFVAVSAGAPAQISIGFGTALPGTVDVTGTQGARAWVDRRLAGTPATRLRLGDQAVNPIFGDASLGFFDLPLGEVLKLDALGIVLPQDVWMSVACFTASQALRGTFWFEEWTVD